MNSRMLTIFIAAGLFTGAVASSANAQLMQQLGNQLDGNRNYNNNYNGHYRGNWNNNYHRWDHDNRSWSNQHPYEGRYYQRDQWGNPYYGR